VADPAAIDWSAEQEPQPNEPSAEDEDWLAAMPLPKPGMVQIPEPPRSADDTRPSQRRTVTGLPQPATTPDQPAPDLMTEMLKGAEPPSPPGNAPVRMTAILTSPEEPTDPTLDLPAWLRDDESTSGDAGAGRHRGESVDADGKPHFDIDRRPAWMRGKRPGQGAPSRPGAAGTQGKDRKKDKQAGMPDDIANLLDNILDQQDSDLPDWMRE
jgi:hypothetical protein